MTNDQIVKAALLDAKEAALALAGNERGAEKMRRALEALEAMRAENAKTKNIQQTIGMEVERVCSQAADAAPPVQANSPQECAARKALEEINSLAAEEISTRNHAYRTTVFRIYDLCRALSQPCPCEELRQENGQLRADAERWKKAHDGILAEAERMVREARVDLEAENAALREKVARLTAALEMLYDRWENGEPCFEDPLNQYGPLGNAVRLSAEEENEILALIPRYPWERFGSPQESKPVAGPVEEAGQLTGSNAATLGQRNISLTKEQWIEKYGGQEILDAQEFDVVACNCDDTICHGWRVTQRHTDATPAQDWRQTAGGDSPVGGGAGK